MSTTEPGPESPGLPPSPPAKLPLPGGMSTFDAVATWPTWEAVAAKYPAITSPGTLASARFAQMIQAVWTRGMDMMAVADLVMAYPPRAVRLECDRDQDG